MAESRLIGDCVAELSAGCIGITALDATMLAAITLIVPAVVIWPVILATAASPARILYATRSLRTVLAR